MEGQENQKGQQFQCTGDCLKCMPIQRQYCASQFTYNTMRMVERLTAEVQELKEKVKAMLGNEEMLFEVAAGEEVTGGEKVTAMPPAEPS